MNDKAAISSLVARLAHLADDGDPTVYANLFSHDAVWCVDTGDAPLVLRGRDDIEAGAVQRRAAGRTGPGSNMRHVITTHAIEVDGDGATGRCYVLLVRTGSERGRPPMLAVYDDRYVREPDGWRLASRVIRVE